jgi:hypothetical protein
VGAWAHGHALQAAHPPLTLDPAPCAQIGKQTLSTSVTLPAYGFGGSTREQEGNRFLTSGHAAKQQHGKYSPAHMNNQTDRNLSSFGKQSARASPPAYGFGSTPKMTFKTSTTPGPGSYD